MRQRTKRTLLTSSLLISGLAMAASGAGAPGPAAKMPPDGATTPVSSAEAGPCFPPTPTAGAGVVDPFRMPSDAAAQLNADGKAAYRKGQWDEARAKYRAAEKAAPDFLAPALNVACSFVRQERYAEAAAEVKRIVGLAYLPWKAEVLTAFDLSALKARPEMRGIQEAFEAARRDWVGGLDQALVFVARTRPPLKVPPEKTGVFVLAPRQELFAWEPTTARYRQLTTEEGRVLGALRSTDRRRVALVTAEKVVRETGKPARLRGVTLIELDLGTLEPGARAVVPDDVERLDLIASGAHFAYRIKSVKGTTAWTIRANRLDVIPLAPKHPAGVSVSAAGVTGSGTAKLDGACAGEARDKRDAEGRATIVIGPRSTKGPRITIKGYEGAGLNGLPLP